MLGIDKVCLLPSEFSVAILQFVDEWADSEIDDWAIFLMDAVNCAYDEMRFDDDKVRAALQSAYESSDADIKARAVIATLRLGEDGFEDQLRALADSKDRYNPLVAADMRDLLLSFGCDQELFDAPQLPENLEKLQNLAVQGKWIVNVDDDDKASLAELAQWVLNLMTI